MELVWNCSASERGRELQEEVVEALGLDVGGQRDQLVEVRRGEASACSFSLATRQSRPAASVRGRTGRCGCP